MDHVQTMYLLLKGHVCKKAVLSISSAKSLGISEEHTWSMVLLMDMKGVSVQLARPYF